MSSAFGELVASAQAIWDHRFLDDVATGLLAERHGIRLTPLPSPTLLHVDHVHCIPRQFLRSAHHVRLRFTGANRRDSEALCLIHDAISD